MGMKIDLGDPAFANVLHEMRYEAYVAGCVATAVHCIDGGIVSVQWLREHLPATSGLTLDRALESLLGQRVLVPWSDCDTASMPDEHVLDVPVYGRVAFLAVP